MYISLPPPCHAPTNVPPRLKKYRFDTETAFYSFILKKEQTYINLFCNIDKYLKQNWLL